MRRAWGIYGVFEQPIGGKVTAFVRSGLSDPDTTEIAGALRAGVILNQVVPGIPPLRRPGLLACLACARARGKESPLGSASPRSPS